MSQGRSPPGEPAVIVGRDDELRSLRDFVDRLRIQGGSLLLSGDAGVGKSMLLDAAAQYARAQGYRVVRAAGVEFEAGVSFATLHLVLQPLLGELGNLTQWHRDALTTALGLRDGPRSDQLVLSNATLAVLASAAGSTPLLLIVDDLPWIDRASAAVLGFAARRLSQMPAGLLAASRTGEESLLDQAGLPTRLVPPLTDTAADTLLVGRYPALSPRVRQRLLTEAQGNPLALLELPAALQQHPAAADAGAPLPAVLPLSGRSRRPSPPGSSRCHRRPATCCSQPSSTAPATWPSSAPSPASRRRPCSPRRNGPASSGPTTAAAASRSGTH